MRGFICKRKIDMAKKIVLLFYIIFGCAFCGKWHRQKGIFKRPQAFVNDLKAFFNGTQDKDAQDALTNFMAIWQANTFYGR